MVHEEGNNLPADQVLVIGGTVRNSHAQHVADGLLGALHVAVPVGCREQGQRHRRQAWRAAGGCLGPSLSCEEVPDVAAGLYSVSETGQVASPLQPHLRHSIPTVSDRSTTAGIVSASKGGLSVRTRPPEVVATQPAPWRAEFSKVPAEEDDAEAGLASAGNAMSPVTASGADRLSWALPELIAAVDRGPCCRSLVAQFFWRRFKQTNAGPHRALTGQSLSS